MVVLEIIVATTAIAATLCCLAGLIKMTVLIIKGQYTDETEVFE